MVLVVTVAMVALVVVVAIHVVDRLVDKTLQYLQDHQPWQIWVYSQ